MTAAVRGGGASIRPTLSTIWLSRSLASEARHLDAHHLGQPVSSTLSPLTKKHKPRRLWCSVNRWSGATVPSCESQRVYSSSFAKKSNDEVSGWYDVSKYRLFATSARLYLRCDHFQWKRRVNFLFSACSIVQGETKTSKSMGCCMANFSLFHALKIGTLHGKWTLEWVFKRVQNLSVSVQNLTFCLRGSSFS